MPFLISSAFYPLIGDKIYGPIGKTIDVLAVFATVFGITTSLGLGALQITGGISYVYGVETNVMWAALIIAGMTALFTLATVSGMHKWMSKINNFKVYLSIFFLVFFLLFAGFVFIMQQLTDQHKIALIGEIGTIPSAAALAEEKSEWVSYMTWCGDFALTENNTTHEELRAMYNHPWAITKDRLPELY